MLQCICTCNEDSWYKKKKKVFTCNMKPVCVTEFISLVVGSLFIQTLPSPHPPFINIYVQFCTVSVPLELVLLLLLLFLFYY